MTVRRTGPGAARLVAALKELDGVEGKAGWFETARYADGRPVAENAARHEYGTSKIPARPFMRPAAQQNRGKWRDQLASGAKAVLAGTHTATEVMETVALGAAGDIGAAIQAVTSPPLKPATVKRKGFDKPLIETRQMFQSVTGVAEKKGGGK